MRFGIRDAGPDDHTDLSELLRRSSLSNIGDRVALLANPDALSFSLPAEGDGSSRVAFLDDGRIVGFATPLVAQDFIELDDLFVDPDWMKQGVGRALVRDAVEIAREH